MTTNDSACGYNLTRRYKTWVGSDGYGIRIWLSGADWIRLTMLFDNIILYYIIIHNVWATALYAFALYVLIRAILRPDRIPRIYLYYNISYIDMYRSYILITRITAGLRRYWIIRLCSSTTYSLTVNLRC